MKTASYLGKLLSQKEIKKVEAKTYGNDTLMYIIDYKDGWAVLSADKRITPVLAEASTGTFSKEVENEGSAIWFNQIANEIHLLKKGKANIEENKINQKDLAFWQKIEKVANFSKSKGSNQITARRLFPVSEGEQVYLCKKLIDTRLINEEIKTTGHLLKTKWGQSDPWNVNLPDVSNNGAWVKPPTGCVAVTISQILYFTHFKLNIPSGLHHSVSSTGLIFNDKNYDVSFHRSNYVENSPRWEQMPLTSDGTNTQFVADLMADVGNRVGMKYRADGSGANITQEAMNSFGLTYDESDYNSGIVLGQIRGGMPVMITAYANQYTTGWWLWKETRHSDGHAWVIDGVVDRIRNIEYEYVWQVEIAHDTDAYGSPSYSDMGNYDPVPKRGKTHFDLLAEYDIVLPFDQAISEGKSPNYVEKETRSFPTTNVLMNWGWDGSDDGEYSPFVSSWEGGGYNFQYLRRIYYNVRKK